MLKCIVYEDIIELYFKFDYDIIAKVKTIEGRRFDGQRKIWTIPAKQRYMLDYLFEGKYTVEQPPTITTQHVNFEYKTQPFEHQKESLSYSLAKPAFLLADEQGLGKTKQAIDIAVYKKGKYGIKHTLIVCGVNSVKFNWLNEVEIHSNETAKVLGGVKGSTTDKLKDLSTASEFFLIINIEALRNAPLSDCISKMCKSGEIGFVIIDEVHKAKNPTSKQGKAIHALCAEHKLALTGTPVVNSALDLYNIMRWLGAETFSYYAFRNRYCIMGGFGGYQVQGYKNMDELQRRLGSFMLRRKKEEVLDLPEKLYQVEYVEMSREQQLIYDDVRRSLNREVDQILLVPNPLAKLTRLRQASTCPEVLSSGSTKNAKYERLLEMVEEVVRNNRKCVIFSVFKEGLKVLIPELEKYGVGVITGDTEDRHSVVKRFQNDEECKVLIGTIGAMGTGLTLTAASTAFFLDKPFTPADFDQASDRIHRIGTKGAVNIVSLVCKDTIDEHIENILYDKRVVYDALVDKDSNAMRELTNRLVRESLM